MVAGAVIVAIGGNENLGGGDKCAFFSGVITNATRRVHVNLIVKNGKLALIHSQQT